MPTVLIYRTAGGLVLRCDARCHDAKHTKCVCICGGALHGVGSSPAALRLAIQDAGPNLIHNVPQLGEEIASVTLRDAFRPPDPDQLTLFAESTAET